MLSTLFIGQLKKYNVFKNQLSLKQLTIKTLALIYIKTSDRGQTLMLMNKKKMHTSDESISFVITNKLKTTKRVLKPKIVKCVESSDPALDVCSYVKSYLLEAAKFRNENHDLFYPRQLKSQ